MEGEMWSFMKVCIIVYASLTYSYYISSRIPKGKMRFLSLLPIISIFFLLPMLLSSVLLQFYSGLFIAWLANFKLLLFAFGQDNTLSTNPSMSLLHFILEIALPIKVKQNPLQNITKNDLKTSLTFAINAIIWSFMVQTYVSGKHYILLKNPIVIHVLYSARMLFGIQLIYSLVATLAKSLLGHDLEPQFNDPHFPTSIQNFWGKRWNLMVTSTLKSTIHEPTRDLFTPIMGRRWALHPAILATFAVSGLMHELIHFYVGHEWPTWEVMWFFIINGVCVSIEVEVKKALKGKWRLSPMISIPLTAGFIMVTGIWLCYAELIKCGADVREIKEYSDLIKHAKYTLETLGLSRATLNKCLFFSGFFFEDHHQRN